MPDAPMTETRLSPTPEPAGPWVRRALGALTVAKFASSLYCFLLSIALVGAVFKGLGTDFAGKLIESTSNPFVGLFIGILATSIVQSSSATTSIVVGIVAMRPEFLPNAIPIVMGANIGTTVTCALVSIGHITRKEEFRRAFSGALVHDFFNLIAVIILLPLELATGFLQKGAVALSGALWASGAAQGGASHGFTSPLKAILKPVVKAIVGVFKGEELSVAGGIALTVLALALLFGSLWVMSRLMRRAIVGRAEALIDRTIGRAPLLGLVVGLVLTAIVQSSSAVTSILVPLAGAGIITLEQIFPITLGANLGTTVTAILASLAVGPAGFTIALVHMLFNLSGIALIYPLPVTRAIPIRLARGMANLAAESKVYALLFVVGAFFAVPGILILLTRWLG